MRTGRARFVAGRLLLVALVAVSAVVVTSPVFAQDAGAASGAGAPERGGAPNRTVVDRTASGADGVVYRFHAETNVHLDLSLFAAYVSAEPHVVFRPGLLGAGAGVKFAAGASQFDLHLMPFARFEFWWLYVNAGWSFEIVDEIGGSTVRYPAIENGIYLAGGFAPDLLDVGMGRFGIDVGLESFFNPWNPHERPPYREVVAGWGIYDPFFADPIGFVLGWTMVRVGLLYTFPL